MKIVLNDTFLKDNLYPFGIVNPFSSIRIGILTIRERWEFITNATVFDSVASFFESMNDKNEKPDFLTYLDVIPSKYWWDEIRKYWGVPGNGGYSTEDSNIVKTLQHPWQIFQLNDWALRQDFELITSGRKSQPISSTNKIISPENIFLEEGAKVEHSIINASTGPVYIGKNAEVMEGCMVRGPFALCEGAVLKMGAKIYGATTIGPYCNAAGEIKNSVLFAYSNKAHDGYLGDSVIGEWCNLGAGTTNSNVKNTAGQVKVWDNVKKDFTEVGIKCGLLMGDYSRAAINTSFNTGTVVGVSCNIFGEGYPPKLVPDFTWGKEKYIFEKALQDISNWKKLKNKSLTEQEIKNLKSLYNQ